MIFLNQIHSLCFFFLFHFNITLVNNWLNFFYFFKYQLNIYFTFIHLLSFILFFCFYVLPFWFLHNHFVFTSKTRPIFKILFPNALRIHCIICREVRPPTKRIPDLTLICISCSGFSSGNIRSVENPFIDIIQWPNLTRNGSTCLGS